MFTKRIKKLQEELKSLDIDAIYITKKENIYYLTGFTGSFSFLVVGPNKVHFLTDFRYIEQANNETKNLEIVRLEKYSVEYFVFEICKKENYQNLGFEYISLSYQAYSNLTHFFKPERLKAFNNLVENLRMVKDQKEIEILHQAESIGDKVFQSILPFIKVGVKESEIALEIDYQLRKNGASGNSFTTIVASGYRSALPHGVASDKKIEDGDFIVMDFGCFYKGYASDMTRTVGIGQINKLQKEIYDIVLKAQLEALSYIKAGLQGKAIHQIAANVIEEAGYGNYFGHGLGHSVGLEIHEQPNFNPRENRVIESGMCITVEPGVYLPKQFGVRIEDLVVVQNDGHINLTNSPKELICL